MEGIAHDALVTKEKDDIRGAAIISDYQEAYTKASDDSFIKDITRETKEASLKINEIVTFL